MTRMRIFEQTGNVQLMQRINRLKVLDCIRGRQTISRAEIASVLGLSPSSVTNIVSFLLENKLVLERGPADTKEIGRKATMLSFNAGGYTILSINIETEKADIALTGLDAGIVSIVEVPLTENSKRVSVLSTVKAEAAKLMREHAASGGSKIAGVGVAVSGVVSDDERLLVSSSMKWKGIKVKEYFEKAFNLPVFVQNNSRTKALWELRRCLDESDINVVFMDLTKGVGIISFFEHRINDAVAGEFGHTTVKKDGPQCFCGNKGCLEVMCSVDKVLADCAALLEQGQCPVLAGLLQGGGPMTFQTALQAFEAGDKGVESALRDCGEYLGMGLANIINLFNPGKIVINGDVLLTSPFVLSTALEEAGRRALEQFSAGVKYETVNIGPREAIMGISIHVADRLFELPGAML